VGYSSVASAASATALGFDATAAYAGSTAIGTGATTTRANQVVLGGAGSSVTLGSLASSTAAQTGTIYVNTVDASGTLGQGIAMSSIALKSDLIPIYNDSDTLFDLTAQNSAAIKRANEGVAMALAMDTPSLQPGEKIAMTGGVGYYEDEGAVSMALSARIGDNAWISAGGGVGLGSGEVGARGGFRVGW
jgi:hypothetical protein